MSINECKAITIIKINSVNDFSTLIAHAEYKIIKISMIIVTTGANVGVIVIA